MAAWLDVSATGFPKRTRIKVLLRDGSEDGEPLSGDVTIAIRKGNRVPSTRPLGLQNTNLVVSVVDGRWESPTWDYQYWADQRFDTLVAKFRGAQDATWGMRTAVEERRDRRPVPTSISKITQTESVDSRNPEIMRYIFSWTILDQFGKPIQGTVTRLFDGDTAVGIDSIEGRPGVCSDSVFVIGYGKQVPYHVIPPTGETNSRILHGPKKPEEKPAVTMASLSDLNVTSMVNPTDSTKLLYTVYWTVVGSDGKVFKDPTVSRLFGGGIKPVTGGANGLCHEDNVEVSTTGTYTVFIPGATGVDARKSVELTGPAKKDKPEEGKSIEPGLQLVIQRFIEPQEDGRFIVPVITKLKNGELGARQLTVVSEGGPVEMLAPLTQTGSTFSFETPRNGLTDVVLLLRKKQVTFRFELDNNVVVKRTAFWRNFKP